MAWYRNDKAAVAEALRRGERPDLATTMASGPLDELVALHQELGSEYAPLTFYQILYILYDGTRYFVISSVRSPLNHQLSSVMGSNAPREKAGFPLESIFAGVIAKPSDEPAYTEELNESSAVVLLFPRLFIG